MGSVEFDAGGWFSCARVRIKATLLDESTKEATKDSTKGEARESFNQLIVA